MRLLYIELRCSPWYSPRFGISLVHARPEYGRHVAEEEITRYFTLTMWISVYTFASTGPAVTSRAGHSCIRFRSRHAIHRHHIIEFYFNFPLYVLLAVRLDLRADRLPLYAKGISFR